MVDNENETKTIPELHKEKAQRPLRAGVLTISTSRHDKLDLDVSGKIIIDLLKTQGCEVFAYMGRPDDVIDIQEKIRDWVADDAVDLIITTGGTGVSPDDVTVEAVEPLLSKRIPGFGELFRLMSYKEVGVSSFASRAFGGVIDKTLIFCLPGSPAAVKLAMELIILPEAGHLLAHIKKKI